MRVDECDEAVHMHAQPLLTKLFCVFVRGQYIHIHLHSQIIYLFYWGVNGVGEKLAVERGGAAQPSRQPSSDGRTKEASLSSASEAIRLLMLPCSSTSLAFASSSSSSSLSFAAASVST